METSKMSKDIGIFKVVSVLMGIFVTSWIIGWIFFSDPLLTALDDPTNETIVIVVNTFFLILHFVFLFYIYRIAKIMNSQNLIDIAPITLVIIQFVVTPVTFFMIFPGYIIPIYMWRKTGKLKPVGPVETAKQCKPGTRKITKTPLLIVGNTLVIISVLLILLLLTFGVYMTLMVYDFSQDGSIFITFFLAILLTLIAGIGGYMMIKRQKNRDTRELETG